MTDGYDQDSLARLGLCKQLNTAHTCYVTCQFESNFDDMADDLCQIQYIVI